MFEEFRFITSANKGINSQHIEQSDDRIAFKLSGDCSASASYSRDSPEPHLGDNFRVQVTIVLQEAGGVPMVPESSLFRGKEGWRVFVIDGGRAS
ncbi:MAG TPA: hypothetical protein VN371_02920 [Chlorobaculum sp.]|nr:hypothetical protein [Chlorobaculum sp.]